MGQGNGEAGGLSRPVAKVVKLVCDRLVDCRRALFVTGAVMSVDSGLPTYRGVGGLYEGIATEDGMAIEDALSGHTMESDPALSWKYILEIERTTRGARPNRGHECIAELEQHFDELWILTQNVDGLHRAAGSTQVIDIHGNVRELMCSRDSCDYRERVTDFAGLSCPPRCPKCDAIVRPDVVLFGEMLPTAKVDLLRQRLVLGFDAVVSVGTSSLFPYISQPVTLARRSGALTVEINPGQTHLSDVVDHHIAAQATVALAAIVADLNDR
ncbi:MAG: NAD-dependent protein deacylase [Deltaproteobacteria bacterium]|nr:NAD-dependent protein deacylase [Deltaproteobacteria bacterium]